jgi:hypothetical protein
MQFRYSWTEASEQPEAVALRALGFLANNRAELQRFLSRSGLSAADLERQPVDRHHLSAVLDFLLADETVLERFTRAADLPTEAAYEARRLFNHRTAARRTPNARA